MTASDPVAYLQSKLGAIEAGGEIDRIVAARDEVLEYFAAVFDPSNLESLTADQFKDFLRFDRNQHWNGIHRHQTAITQDMDRLRPLVLP